METTRITGTIMIETRASRVFSCMMAVKLIIKMAIMRATPTAWSLIKRRRVSTSEEARSSKSPVFTSA
jgi:hypothetical protein